MKKKNALILAGVWLLIMVSIVASTLTLLISNHSDEGSLWVSRREFEMIKRYSRLEEVRKALTEDYYQELDEEALITGALRGMMAAAQDPYTFYYTPEEMELYNQQSSAGYSGVGFLLQNNRDGEIEVIRVYSGGPADCAGVKVGDLILRVDGESVSGESQKAFNEAVAQMKGEDGTQVILTLKRGDVTQEAEIVRGSVNVTNVSCSMLFGGVGYINIYQFTGDDVTAFEAALSSLQKAEAQGLVIDLRSNPGGILDDVVAIADALLPEGVVVYTQDREGGRVDYYSDAEHVDLPVAVLINDMSASAAEILAAAVQDFNRGTIVGEKSYGKGIVQSVVQFEEDGAGMQYTSSSYYTPSGRSIHGVGVTPDLQVENKGAFVIDPDDPDIENDLQLQAAVDAVIADIQKGN